MNKKAQAQIITTVLIILLVLAAIVIVWVIIRGTIQTASEDVTTQTGCFGLTMEITNLDATGTTVTVRPTRDITDHRIFIDDTEQDLDDVTPDVQPSGGPLNAADTATYTLAGIVANAKVTIEGKTDVWCSTATAEQIVK